MSRKEELAISQALELLHTANLKHGRKVSAGELAKVMGVSRNTAYNRLMALVALDLCQWESQPYKKGFCMRYAAVGGFK